jgi:hypothetical protein
MLPWPQGTFKPLNSQQPYTFHIKAKLDYTTHGKGNGVGYPPSSLFWQTHVVGSGSCGNSPGGPGLSVRDDHPGRFQFWDNEWGGVNLYVGHFTKGVPFNLTVRELMQQQGQPIQGYAKLYQDGKLIAEQDGVNLEPPPCDTHPFWDFGPYSFYYEVDGLSGTSTGTFTEMTVTTP